MKVTNVLGSYGIYTNKPAVSGKKIKNAEKKDDVAISKNGRDFHFSFKALLSADDIRDDKVAQIKDKIDSGNYSVSAEDIADKILSQRMR